MKTTESDGLRYALWFALVASGSLILWQAVAFFSGRVPEHILPLLSRLSGTQEDVPLAYAWTWRIGLLSVLAFVGSGILLCWLRFGRKGTRS